MSAYHSSDIKAVVDNIMAQTITKVETLIETKIPFE
jgi:hypothetical protein